MEFEYDQSYPVWLNKNIRIWHRSGPNLNFRCYGGEFGCGCYICSNIPEYPDNQILIRYDRASSFCDDFIDGENYPLTIWWSKVTPLKINFRNFNVDTKNSFHIIIVLPLHSFYVI